MSSAPPPAELDTVPRSTVVAVVAATTMAQIASIMGAAVFPVIAPELARALGVRPALIGYQVSLIYGAAMFASPFVSGMVTRWGACRMMQVSLALCAVAVLLGMTSSLAALVATSVLLGVGISVITPSSAHLLFRFTPAKNRNLIFSLKQTGVPLAWMLVGTTAPAVTLAFGWRWAMAVVFVIVVAMLVVLEPARAGWDDDRKRAAPAREYPLRGIMVLWRRPALRWLAFSSFCFSFVQLCFGAYAVIMLVAEAGYSLVAAGLMLSLAQAAGVAGRIFWGWIADATRDSFGTLLTLNALMVACCVATALVSPAWRAPALSVLFVVFGASAIGWNGVFLAEVSRLSPPGGVSVATGGAMVWNFGGILVGPAAFATAYGLIGSYTATFGLLVLIAGAGVVFLWLGRRAAVAARPR
ncbi:MAG: MFS transporter [Betaproteobacteria bacterium]|nr:MFS transporter [Betaproteobacteria bacterium]